MSGRRPERSNARTKSRRSTRHRRGPQVSRSAANVLVFERRVLIGVTIFTLLGTIFWIVAISTDYWYSVTVPDQDGIYVNHTNSYLIRSDVGLWRACRTHRRVSNTSTHPMGKITTTCLAHQMFPSRKEVAKKQGEIDHTILDFTRTETAFAIIAIILMVMGHGFSFYTFIEQRYMFKRLAGGIHFITAATVVVVVEVLNNAAKYAEVNLKVRHPTGSSWHFGYSFVLAWISFTSYLIAGIAFIACSRKRKHLEVLGLHGVVSDEPHILGRA